MVGATFSHYRILGQIGAGGMGVVYHALDTDLRRPVAIKFLHPDLAARSDLRERFLREARAAAALAHPNICTIHEVGRTETDLYIVMQLVEGQNLADRLRGGRVEPDALRTIIRQLADALREAHQRGIVHRDLKPSNIMVGQSGHVTLLDFGLAAITRDRLLLPDESTTTGQALTSPGQIAGTIGYMAPEQILEGRSTPASDMFALGVTLYELATGHHPFRRQTAVQTMASVLSDSPVPLRSLVPDFPGDLENIVFKCLEKREGQRLADGEALARALSEPAVRHAPRTRAGHRSIAVLTFDDEDGGGGHLSRGLTAEIITRLSRLRGLLVISLTAAERFRESGKDALQIGRELNVETVLQGTIKRHNSQYRIAVQLLEVGTGFCLWAHNYDVDEKDLVHIQELVSERVARALRRKLPAHPGGVSSPTGVRADAYRLHLQGKALFYRFNSTDNLLAIEAFRRALSIDSTYAPAQAGLASACMARIDREWETDEDRWVSQALQSCDRALAADPWISEAYSAKGLVFLRRGQLAEAETEFRRALAINPNDDIAHCMCGRILFETGDLLGALRAYRRALRISPDYVWCWNDLAWVQWLLGRFPETERSLSRALSINPMDEIARIGVATGEYFLGQWREAIATAERSLEINPRHPFTRPVLAVALARDGQLARAESLCREAVESNPEDFFMSAAWGLVHAVAGDAVKLRAANEHALTIPAPRVPLNLNIAVHYAFLEQPACARAWIAKADREGMRTDVAIAHNTFLRSSAGTTAGHPHSARRRSHARRAGATLSDAHQGEPDRDAELKPGRLDH
ncbi:MAG: protein kinase [Acidobacteria bacterium]|nr:protein kinase [Acidobacteriota bacterium]